MDFQKKEIRSIVLIDDDKDDFEILTEAMQEINPGIFVYYFNTYDDKAECINSQFDLVLLDINMPKYDGFYWLKSIRGKKPEVPIIMYTNSTSPVHIAQSYKEGANLFFPKPENYLYLKKSLEVLIHLDWSNPSAIKDRYSNKGHYKIFKPE